MQWDVAPFGATYLQRSFAKAMEAYRGAPGSYSPPIIHLTTYSERGHYVVVAGQLSESQFVIVDPANDSTWNATIQNNVVTYSRNGTQRTEELEPVTQYQRNGSPSFTAPSAPSVPSVTTTPAPEQSRLSQRRSAVRVRTLRGCKGRGRLVARRH